MVDKFASGDVVASRSEHPAKSVRINAPKDNEVEPRLLVEIIALEKDKLINRKTNLIKAEFHTPKPMRNEPLSKALIGREYATTMVGTQIIQKSSHIWAIFPYNLPPNSEPIQSGQKRPKP